MLTREEMQRLTQEIIGCYEARTSGIASLRGEVAAQRRDLRQAHQAMAQKQHAELARGHADLIQEVNGWLKDAAAARQAMGQKQRAELAQARAELIEYEAGRKSEVNGWMNEVATAHAGARNEWREMAATLHAKRGMATVATPAKPSAGEAVPAEASARRHSALQSSPASRPSKKRRHRA